MPDISSRAVPAAPVRFLMPALPALIAVVSVVGHDSLVNRITPLRVAGILGVATVLTAVSFAESLRWPRRRGASEWVATLIVIGPCKRW